MTGSRGTSMLVFHVPEGSNPAPNAFYKSWMSLTSCCFGVFSLNSDKFSSNLSGKSVL